jgi:putative ABC transport system permease protein
VVITHRLWQRRFGGAPDVIGRGVTINGDAYTVAAVMPASFSAASRSDVWMFWRFAEQDRKQHGEAMNNFIVRIRHGASPQSVESALNALARQQQRERYAKLTLRLQPLSERIIGNSVRILSILSGAVGLVLLVSCVNAGSLLLVRGIARSRETAVRTALGAGRWQVMRPIVGEAAVLALLAAAAGTGLAWALVEGLKRLLQASTSMPLPRLDQTSVDGPALAIALCSAALCIALASAAPAMAALRVQAESALSDGHRSSSPGRSTVRFGVAAALVQTALSVILLVGAGLLLRSVSLLIEQDPGYDREGVLTARIPMPFDARQRFGTEAQYQHYRDVIDSVRALPGVQSAAVTTVLPLGRVAASIDFVPEGQAPPAEPQYVQAYGITPEYFRVMRIPMHSGRTFTDEDTPDRTPVVVINEVTARRYWPGEDPVGKRVKGNIPMVVVGVVGGVRRGSMREPPKEEIYRPLPQFLFALHGSTLVLRTMPGIAPESLAQPVRDLLTSRFPNFPVAEVRPMKGWIQDSVAAPRLYGVLLAGFAVEAVLIACIGLYGLLAHTAANRRRELGIRLAVGARPTQLVSLLVRRGLAIVLAGVAAGIACGVVFADVLRSQLYGVQTTDPVTLSAVLVSFLVVALFAMLLPALQAARTNPVEVLRAE